MTMSTFLKCHNKFAIDNLPSKICHRKLAIENLPTNGMDFHMFWLDLNSSGTMGNYGKLWERERERGK